MKRFQPRYRQTLQKAARLSIAVLVSLSVLSTGVLANVVCGGVCCMDTRAGHHASGNGMKISKLPQPCCCSGVGDSPCQAMTTDSYPRLFFSKSTVRYHENRMTPISSGCNVNSFHNCPGAQAAMVPALSVRPVSTPLYLNTLALLC